MTITCNRGIELFTPDVYFVSDMVACERWARRAYKSGAKCVTLQRDKSALELRGVHCFHEFIREGTPYEPFQLSGLWCLEHACRQPGTERVHCVGMEGYGSGYCNGDDDSHLIEHNDRILSPLTSTILRKYPRVDFVFYGKPSYRLPLSGNWRWVNV